MRFWLKTRHLILLGSTAVAGITFFAVTAPYRLKRLTSFRDPFQYEDGDGYQLIHSYLAMNSGGLTGNGLGGSIQKLGFLPEAHTDFIMAIISEEFGHHGDFDCDGCISTHHVSRNANCAGFT